ncbi:MAG: glycerol-3-phosphate 1-O-acyltransferase PlsY [Thermodesulfovibrionia bacterium]|nr:glycerol-3-phosphate 1-O-acyltransferase PlsY [Thermodesulfovibrionia bacterium]MCK5426406.1 glycerol-3-phosphate 1-O-acyltransferase PlsY [Thermodesulfovibrionia bacterium]MCK5511275.1 glycerol-3-phosphate 1-O-acyltransferase PlsY [Thermodesulfovibrionia bacterium]
MTDLQNLSATLSFLFEPQMYLIPTAYIIGSIPFGILVAKQKGIDLQNVGSKNIGATNVLRSVGKVPAIITLLGDSLKGTSAVLLGRVMIGDEFWEGIMGIMAVLGHLFSVFLSFRGGKGVATGFGVFIVYSPVATLIALVIWIFTAIFTRYSSLAAITAFLSLPVLIALFDATRIKISFAILITFLIILRHRENIKNLIRGTEDKFRDKERP